MMDEKFCKALLNKPVSVDYRNADKNSFINGVILKVTPKYVVIANKDFMLSILYSSLISIRTIKGDENEVG